MHIAIVVTGAGLVSGGRARTFMISDEYDNEETPIARSPKYLVDARMSVHDVNTEMGPICLRTWPIPWRLSSYGANRGGGSRPPGHRFRHSLRTMDHPIQLVVSGKIQEQRKVRADISRAHSGAGHSGTPGESNKLTPCFRGWEDDQCGCPRCQKTGIPLCLLEPGPYSRRAARPDQPGCAGNTSDGAIPTGIRPANP